MATPITALDNAVEQFSAPIESVIIALGQGIAEAQKALDKNSIATQEAIDSDPVLSQYGLQATWYQFPTVSLQLKMSLTITQDQTQSSPSSASPNVAGPHVALSPALLAPARLRLIAQPLSASFQNQFNYDSQAATQVNLTIVPVPPPKSGNQVTSPPQMTEAAVVAVAESTAQTAGTPFITNKNSQGQIEDSSGNVYTISTTYNATSGTWYVLEYAPSNPTISAIAVAVDDATQTGRVVTPSQ
jgi:hypothetical protein